MFNEGHSDDYTPITTIGRWPIYLTELLVMIHIASMVVLALGQGITGSAGFGTSLIFSPPAVLGDLQVWRLFSYAFLNFAPVGFGGVIWYLVGLVMLWWCGRQIEQFYGRRSFLFSYLLLIVVPAGTALLPGLGMPVSGPEFVHFGVFVLFAATYPGVQLLFSIPAKWCAWAILGFNSLFFIAARNLPGMIWLWLTALTAYGLTRWMGRGVWLPESWSVRIPQFRRQPKFTVVRPAPKPREVTYEADPISSIDPILEKIAKSGMDSLTARERAALRAASGELQRKGGGK